jgi:hypothetical protein
VNSESNQAVIPALHQVLDNPRRESTIFLSSERLPIRKPYGIDYKTCLTEYFSDF